MSVNGSSERSFVDTNILLYSFDDSAAEKKRIAVDLTRQLWRSETGCVSIQVLQEFYVNAVRKLPIRLSESDAREVIAQLRIWRVHQPGPDDVLAAVDLHRESDISFWDAMIVQSASKLGCETLYSEDLNPGQKLAGVEVVNPFA